MSTKKAPEAPLSDRAADAADVEQAEPGPLTQDLVDFALQRGQRVGADGSVDSGVRQAYAEYWARRP